MHRLSDSILYFYDKKGFFFECTMPINIAKEQFLRRECVKLFLLLYLCAFRRVRIYVPFGRRDQYISKGGLFIKILNSNIGMESARKYSEYRMDASNESSWGITGVRSASAFSELTLSMGEYHTKSGEESSSTERSEKASEDPADAIKKRYEDLKAQVHSRFDDEHTLFIEMQAACIDYLLMIFLGIDTSKWKHVTDMNGNSPMSMLSGLRSVSEAGINGVSYGEYHYHEESETTTFSTQGTAVTADGRKLSFGLEVEMSRSFVEESSMEIEYGVSIALDPLVVQLSGTPGSVSDQSFMFDLDSDGVEDKIARLCEGSGFLALDKNDDGTINDGSELFGTVTGNGFEELAEYDEDHNGWIDENDDIYQRLRIWTKDHKGNDVLTTLKESDIGAIYLDSRKTSFSVRGSRNEELAHIGRSGIFLRESSGSAGVIQQFDMVKQAYA